MDEANDLAEFCVDADTRSAMILLVSFLEDTLKKVYIEYWHLNSNRDVERYFGANGPLSTFAQRALVAKGQNWITAKQVIELDILRKIRNELAHRHRVHSLTEEPLRGFAMSLEPREEIWCREEGSGYKSAFEAASEEVRICLRVFCAGMFNVSSILTNSKLSRAQIPVGFRPDKGWESLLEVEQGLIDAAMRYCWRSLGMGYTGATYQYRRDRTGIRENGD